MHLVHEVLFAIATGAAGSAGPEPAAHAPPVPVSPASETGADETETEFKRKGGQWGLTVGAALCVPGRAACARDDNSETPGGLSGTTGPSIGAGFEIGFRFSKYLFTGLGYDFGMYDVSYRRNDGSMYERGMQHGIYLELRPIFPIGRFDVGMSVAPGVSHQVFTLRSGDKEFAQGFSLKLGPTLDVFVSRQVFLGGKLDLMLNIHRETCRSIGEDETCASPATRDVVPVHQLLFGLHVGTTFL